jgi:hypothetical protein
LRKQKRRENACLDKNVQQGNPLVTDEKHLLVLSGRVWSGQISAQSGAIISWSHRCLAITRCFARGRSETSVRAVFPW